MIKKQWKMKRVKSSMALLSLLALTDFGCASSKPSDGTVFLPTSSPDLEQAKITQPEQETPWGWQLFYELANLGGTVGASNSPETPR